MVAKVLATGWYSVFFAANLMILKDLEELK